LRNLPGRQTGLREIRFCKQLINLLCYNDTPIQEIKDPVLDIAGVRLIVKREDLNHPTISGNKWWKLKYNLEEARRLDYQTLLTFGGAFSNHLYATAAAARELGFRSIGIVRGEEILPLNPTLTFATQSGMLLHYLSREAYREKNDPALLEEMRKKFGDFYPLPEGGTNDLAVRGCAEFGRSLSAVEFDYLCLPVGTGGTMAGITGGLNDQKEVIGISVLKNGDFLRKEVGTLIENNFKEIYGKWTLLTSYHHGGYARVTKELVGFIKNMKEKHDLPLDPVYTGKLLWAVMEEVKKGMFRRGSTILALHTGGLQGASTLLNQYEETSP
jgi:1-aminocyclopropane-1-carboxylate deaminase